MCSGPIKFLTKTVWLSGHNPCVRLVFCRLQKSLSAPGQETNCEAKAAAHTEGGLISLIDLHCRGYKLTARVNHRLCADLMPNISPRNQLMKIVSLLCVCTSGVLPLFFTLLFYLFTPPPF